MSARREATLLAATCMVLYLTGTADIAFYTRGEPREGLVVREMLARGEWLVPARPEGEPARKPPLYYWSAALALGLLPGTPERALRLPSAVFATAAVLGTWATARTVWGPAAGLPAALVLATAFEWTRAATSARVDMALAAALTAVLAGWTLVLANRGRHWLAVAALGAALGTLAKGPVALVLPALVAVALAAVRREPAALRVLQPVVVLGGAAAVAAMWYVAAFRAEGGALLSIVVQENLLRFVDAEGARTGHAHAPGYLLPLALVGVLPWTPLLPLALAPLRRDTRGLPAVLAATWVVVTLVFFSLAAAKRSVYLLPAFPAVALLVGAGIAHAPPDGRLAGVARGAAHLYLPAAVGLALVTGAVALGLDVTAPVRPLLKPADVTATTALLAEAVRARTSTALLAVLTAGAALALARQRAWRQLVMTVAAVMVAWVAFFDGILHPAIARARTLQPFLAEVGRRVPAAEPLLVSFPPDPGLRFYAPRPLVRWRPRDGGDGGHLLLWEDEWRPLRDAHGEPLRVLAVSDAHQPSRGHLALVVAPRGPVQRTTEAAGPPAPPGLRTGSRSP
jgi:4-amino-4-deoxy-L-arabinose transferase-like glycosyltransferase